MSKRNFRKIARRILEKKAYFPQGDPNNWFPHKYTPLPPEQLLIQRSIPVGDLNLIKNPGTGFVKDPLVHRNEIEMALRESGLYARDIDDAMALLPNMEAFYLFLQNIGLDKQVRLIRSLLEW